MISRDSHVFQRIGSFHPICRESQSYQCTNVEIEELEKTESMSFSSAVGENMKIVNSCVYPFIVHTGGDTVSFN